MTWIYSTECIALRHDIRQIAQFCIFGFEAATAPKRKIPAIVLRVFRSRRSTRNGVAGVLMLAVINLDNETHSNYNTDGNFNFSM